MTILWICVTLLAVVMEIVTVQLVSLWFVGGGIVAFVMSLFEGIGWQWQLLAFVLISIGLLILARPTMVKVMGINKNSRSNVDELISKKVRMLSDADFDKNGTAKINDVIWTIKAVDGTTLKQGDIVKIVKVEGNKLIAMPCEEDNQTTTTTK